MFRRITTTTTTYGPNRNNLAQANSTLQQRVNSLKKRADAYRRCAEKRKAQAVRTNSFIHKLLEEGRVSKEELKPYFPKTNKVTE